MILNIPRKNIEFQKPIDIKSFNYNGELIKWNNKRIDIAVTPNHNMLTTGPKMSRFALRKAGNLRYAHVPISAGWNGNNTDNICIGSKKFKFSDFCEFMGWYLSEGWIDSDPNSHHYRYGISQSKETNRTYIKNLLTRM